MPAASDHSVRELANKDAGRALGFDIDGFYVAERTFVIGVMGFRLVL